jgi:hypothetical protein
MLARLARSPLRSGKECPKIARTPGVVAADESSALEGVRWPTTLEIGDRHWTLVFSPTGGRGHQGGVVSVVLAANLIGTVPVAVYS